MQLQQPGYSSSQGYLKLFTDLPWKISNKKKNIDLQEAKECLDGVYFGLRKVKKQIIEYLVVWKLKPNARGLVLHFVGPSGVAKISLASSITGDLDIKCVWISLGGE